MAEVKVHHPDNNTRTDAYLPSSPYFVKRVTDTKKLAIAELISIPMYKLK